MTTPVVMYEEEYGQLKNVIARLCADSNAKFVFLVDKNGQQIASVGEMKNLDITSLASLTAGANLWQTPLPAGLKRYTRVAWRVGTAALTAGKFTAFYSLDLQRNIARPSGFSVS